MAFTSVSEASQTRRASITSFEAWLPSGLHKSPYIEMFTPYDEFLFKFIPIKGNCLKQLIKLKQKIEIEGNDSTLILRAEQRKSVLNPIRPPISVHTANPLNTKILQLEPSPINYPLFWNCDKEMEVVSSCGIIGTIRTTFHSREDIKTYEIVDSFSQSVFHVTPNLAPHNHKHTEFLILGSERSFLTGALFSRNQQDFTLEIFKPISPLLKALLVSFSLQIIFNSS